MTEQRVTIIPPTDLIVEIGGLPKRHWWSKSRTSCLGLMANGRIRCADVQTARGCRGGPQNDSSGCGLRNQAISSAPGIKSDSLESAGFEIKKA